MSMTFDEYIEKRVNQAVEEAVHKVSVNFANNGTDYESDRCKGFVLP